MAHHSQRGTILVVDDNLDICRLARIFLEKAGYVVITASDGEEGLRAYQQHRSSVVLLLTDVMMPKVSGVELANRVLGMDSQLPVLFMSGSESGSYQGQEFLPKPFRPAELIEVVSRALSASTQSRSIHSTTGAFAQV
jgi:two-component system, cell cycle sensor histidine kinase and response regulator CckA